MAEVNSEIIGIVQFNSNSISELEWEFELNDLVHNELEMELKDFALNLNWKILEWKEKELNIWYFCDTVKDILQTFVSIAVHAMVFNDQEKLDNEAAD